MKAVYDLEYCPTTWEIVNGLVTFELERIRRDEPTIDLIFAPGSREGFRPNYAWPPATGDREAMMRDVLLPCCDLLPSVASVTRWNGPRDELRGCYGFEAKPFLVPQQHLNLGSPHGRPFRASGVPRRDPKLVTITLREAAHQQERNSKVAEWASAAHQLGEAGFRTVVVRDTRAAGAALTGLTTDPDASRYVDARARLYATAAVNLFVPNGPQMLSLYLDAPTLVFRPICETVRCTSTDYLRSLGLEPGGQIRGMPSHQRYVWADDVADVIVPETLAFLNGGAA